MSVTDTSLSTYQELIQSGKAFSERQKILFLLAEVGSLTSAEVANIAGISRHNSASRLADLSKINAVQKSEKRTCEVCNRVCYSWEIVEAA